MDLRSRSGEHPDQRELGLADVRKRVGKEAKTQLKVRSATAGAYGIDSHFSSTGVSGNDLPSVVKLLKVHGGVAHYLLLRIGERNGPPGQGKRQVRFEKFDLNTGWIDIPHRVAVRVAVHVRIVKLLPAVKLLGINDNQELGRLPIDLQMTFNIVSVPAIEHFEQHLVDLLGVRRARGGRGRQRVELPTSMVLRHRRRRETERNH
jgi:hypothetical protein